MLAQFSERLQPQPRNLQLEIEKRPRRKLPQNIFQCGQRQALRRRVLDLHPSDGRVMADHSLPIGGKPHVEFEPVAAVAQTELKRCQSMFRNLAESPSPTMHQKKRKTHASVCFSRRPRRLGGEKAATPQSKSKSRIGFPVSGVSLAFFTASWNFFSSSSEACFCASIDWRKMESRRLSCSFMARAASSMSLKVFGLTGAVCAMMPRVAESIFMTAPQQGQITSKLDSRFTTRDHTAIRITAASAESAEYGTRTAVPNSAAGSTPRPPESPAFRQNLGQISPRSEEHTSELQSLRHLVC